MGYKWAERLRTIGILWFFGVLVVASGGQNLGGRVSVYTFLALLAMPPILMHVVATYILTTTPVSAEEAFALIRDWGTSIVDSGADFKELRLPAPLPRMKQAFRVVVEHLQQRGDAHLVEGMAVGHMMMADTLGLDEAGHMAASLQLLQEWSAIVGEPESPGDIAAQVVGAADEFAEESEGSFRTHFRDYIRDLMRRAARDTSG